MLRLEASDGTWVCGRVIPAFGFFSRLLGMSGRDEGEAVLFHGGSVQTNWMTRTIAVVFLDEFGVVRWSGWLPPGRIHRVGGATWVLETAWPGPMPAPGTSLRVSLTSETCQAS